MSAVVAPRAVGRMVGRAQLTVDDAEHPVSWWTVFGGWENVRAQVASRLGGTPCSDVHVEVREPLRHGASYDVCARLLPSGPEQDVSFGVELVHGGEVCVSTTVVLRATRNRGPLHAAFGLATIGPMTITAPPETDPMCPPAESLLIWSMLAGWLGNDDGIVGVTLHVDDRPRPREQLVLDGMVRDLVGSSAVCSLRVRGADDRVIAHGSARVLLG